MRGKTIRATIVAIVLLVLVYDVAEACEPRDHGAEINLSGSEAAFLGRVIERTEEQQVQGPDRVCTVFKYRFRVAMAWKGVSDQEISVYGVYGCKREEPPSFLDCEILDWGEFEVGQTYLVYASYGAQGEDNSLWAWIGDAGMSKPLAEASGEILDLTALAPPKVWAGMPIAGTVHVWWLYAGLLGCALGVGGLLIRRYASG